VVSIDSLKLKFTVAVRDITFICHVSVTVGKILSSQRAGMFIESFESQYPVIYLFNFLPHNDLPHGY
jgi:hypothetical protein